MDVEGVLLSLKPWTRKTWNGSMHGWMDDWMAGRERWLAGWLDGSTHGWLMEHGVYPDELSVKCAVSRLWVGIIWVCYGLSTLIKMATKLWKVLMRNIGFPLDISSVLEEVDRKLAKHLIFFYPGTPRRLLGVIDKYFVITKSNVFLSFSVLE